MKTSLLTVLSFVFCSITAQANGIADPIASCATCQCATETSIQTLSTDPLDYKIVVSQKRIYFLTDEMPIKCLKVKVVNADKKTVLTHCFSSKSSDWFLNIETLPKGEYTLHVGQSVVERFTR